MPKPAPIAILLVVSASCALGGGEDEGDRTAGACTQSAQCGTDQVCNLVTQRCAPTNAAGPDQLRVEFDCLFGGNDATGPAYMSWNFGGRRGDFGAICSARKVGEDYATLLVFAGESEYGVTIELDPTQGPGTLATPGDALVFIDRYGDTPESFAYGTGGSVTITSVDTNRIEGALVVTLGPSFGLGESCEGEPARCGAVGIGSFCNTEDPTGVDTCRRVCAGGRPCGDGETCVTNGDGFELCVPEDGLAGATCERPDDCTSGLCVRGQLLMPDQGYCRTPCDPSRDWCGNGPDVCVGLESGSGACVPNPCSLGACEAGRACKPNDVVDAVCVVAGVVQGTFDAVVTPMGETLMGSSTSNGSVPGIGVWSSDPRSGAEIITASGGQALRVYLVDRSDRILAITLPVAFAVPLRPDEEVRVLVPMWQVAAGIFEPNGDEPRRLVTEGVSGAVAFSRVGTRTGDRITGAFEIAFEEVVR